MVAGKAEGGLTILVVDDHGSCREATARLLRVLGYQALEAADQAQAESLLARHREIAAVVVDLCLGPSEDLGFPLRLQADRPQLPVLFVSGYSHVVCEELGTPGPARRFLEKPFSLSQLEAALEALLGGRPSHARDLPATSDPAGRPGHPTA
jgi:DNA-binding NtrC family response regulator